MDEAQHFTRDFYKTRGKNRGETERILFITILTASAEILARLVPRSTSGGAYISMRHGARFAEFGSVFLQRASRLLIAFRRRQFAFFSLSLSLSLSFIALAKRRRKNFPQTGIKRNSLSFRGGFFPIRFFFFIFQTPNQKRFWCRLVAVDDR